MSIFASLDFAEGSWSFFSEPEFPNPTIEIGFYENGGPVEKFYDLFFGFDVFVNDKKKYSFFYPPSGVTYISTDQIYLVFEQIVAAADSVVVLNVWAENNNYRYEGQETFVVPRPEQPYPSWEWNGSEWVAPVSRPTGYYYSWNEETLEWQYFGPPKPLIVEI